MVVQQAGAVHFVYSKFFQLLLPWTSDLFLLLLIFINQLPNFYLTNYFVLFIIMYFIYLFKLKYLVYFNYVWVGTHIKVWSPEGSFKKAQKSL